MNQVFGSSLSQEIAGNYGGTSKSFAVDAQGRALLSPSVSATISAANLDIRSLSSLTDSLSVTASNLDIRDLSGMQDSAQRYASNYAEDATSGTIPILSTRTFLTKNVGAYAQNTYFVRNLLGVVVNVTLQIAPADIDSYYIDDGGTFSLLGGATLLFVPSTLMKYARVSVAALLNLGNVEVRYFGRS